MEHQRKSTNLNVNIWNGAKKFNSHSNPFCTEYLMDTSQSSHSGGSSRTSSGNGSTCSLFDWGGVVENVFKEEIGKMVRELQWGTGAGGN